MKIRLADKSDFHEIKQLWIDCFGDSNEYIDFYFQNRFSSVYCAVLEDASEIVGMIHLLPCKISPNQKSFYWYAAGIKSNRRNQGLFRKFATAVKEGTNDAGYKNICVPALGLENYYLSLGFISEYRVSDVEYFSSDVSDKNSNKASCVFNAATAEDYLFESENRGDVVWELDAIRYAFEENLYCSGKNLKIDIDGNAFYFFAIEKSDGFLIDYHDIPKTAFEKIIGSLFAELNCKKIIFRTQGNEKIIGLSDSDSIEIPSKITMTLA